MADDRHLEQHIRERAYQIWLDDGKPNGKDREHWQRAERELSAKHSPTTLMPENALVDGGEGHAPTAAVNPDDLTR
jgi:hypothetical protein